MVTCTDRLGELVRDIPDFPAPGVVFKDVTPLLADPLAFAATIDALATGGTAAAAVRLVERLDGHVVGMGFVLELGFLSGRGRIPGRQVVSLLTYESSGGSPR